MVIPSSTIQLTASKNRLLSGTSGKTVSAMTRRYTSFSVAVSPGAPGVSTAAVAVTRYRPSGDRVAWPPKHSPVAGAPNGVTESPEARSTRTGVAPLQVRLPSRLKATRAPSPLIDGPLALADPEAAVLPTSSTSRSRIPRSPLGLSLS